MAVSGRSADVTLSIELESEPISGRVSTEYGAARRFSGWIELVEAIEAARHEPVAGGTDGQYGGT
jgi:hypothetical protein